MKMKQVATLPPRPRAGMPAGIRFSATSTETGSILSSQRDPTFAITRVICIFFMTYVHVNPGLDTFGRLPAHLEWIKLVVGDLLGRASVPALSLIGGVLAVRALQRRATFLAYLAGRARTLIVPMACWNAIAIAFAILILVVTGIRTGIVRAMPEPENIGFLTVVDFLLGVRQSSIVLALAFLRDIFVCSALLPVLILLLRRTGIFGLAAIWVVGMVAGFYPLLLRPHILTFFSLGVFLALGESAGTPTRKNVQAACAAVGGALVIAMAWGLLTEGHTISSTDTAFRLVVSLGIIFVASRLVGTSLGERLQRLEPLAYPVFLAHAVIFTFFWGLWRLYFPRSVEWPYAIFYVCAPPLAFLLVWAFRAIPGSLPESLQIVLFGRRWGGAGA